MAVVPGAVKFIVYEEGNNNLYHHYFAQPTCTFGEIAAAVYQFVGRNVTLLDAGGVVLPAAQNINVLGYVRNPGNDANPWCLFYRI